MSKIHIKILSEDALNYMKKNAHLVADKVIENDTSEWINDYFPQPIFVEKKYEIEDFELEPNPDSANKEIDFSNSVKLYNALKDLPRYILSDERFWLWLHFEKFYPIVKGMMKINGQATIENMWMHKRGIRRGLMFGVLSRCYFRVALSIEESAQDKYHLTRWIIENPLRFRYISWRPLSSQESITRGILKGEKKAIEQCPELEINDDSYTEIIKYVGMIGSVMLIDMISEDDMAELVYNKMMAFNNNKHSWVKDVTDCIYRIPAEEFTLADIYQYSNELKNNHPDNNNIEAKIRQQLQLLTDKGVIAFIETGIYKKLQ